MKNKDTVENFVRLIESRSQENSEAIHLLFLNANITQVVSVIRQELDSLIRVIFLLKLKNKTARLNLMNATIEGKHWRDEKTNRRITDRQMVELANSLKGWTQAVYKFGCAFIHLSNFHEYRSRDPFETISKEEKDRIIKHLNNYHGGPKTINPTFNDIIPYFPAVFEKINSNLGIYLKDLKSKT